MDRSRGQSTALDSSEVRRELAQLGLPKHKRRHPGRWISTVVVLFIAGMLTRSLVLNSKIGWPVVGQFFFSSAILKGLVVTLELTVGGQLLATMLGFVLAAMRHSQNPVLSRLSWLYINVFRGVPLIVQILAWYNLALAFPYLAIGLPFTPWHVQGSTNKIISPFLAGVLALGLAEAAYMAEIVRAGIVAVPRGQFDARVEHWAYASGSDATYRAPPNVAGRHPAHGQPVHRLAESQRARVGHRRQRPPHSQSTDLFGELLRCGLAYRRIDLVPGTHHLGDHRAALSRAVA